MHKRRLTTENTSPALFTRLPTDSCGTSRILLKQIPRTRTERSFKPLETPDIHRTDQNYQWIVDRTTAYKTEEQARLSTTLSALKKTYNVQVLNVNKVADGLKKMMGRMDNYGKETAEYQTDVDRLNIKVSRLELTIQQSKYKQEQAQMYHNVLENILLRLRHDKKYYYLRSQDLEKSLGDRLKANRRQEETEQLVSNQVAQTCFQVGKLEEEFGYLQDARNSQTNEAWSAINHTRRQRMIIEERSDAPTIKEVYGRKLTLVHKFLHQMLRRKVGAMAARHKALNTNYCQIRALTNVEANENLVENYTGKENKLDRLTTEVDRLKELLFNTETRNRNTVQRLKRLQLANLTASSALKFRRIQFWPTIQNANPKMDLIADWVSTRSLKLGFPSQSASVTDRVRDICQLLEELASNESSTTAHFQKRFFNQGISVKKQPKSSKGTVQKMRLAELADITQANQSEVEFINMIRISCKKHTKSRTQV